MCDEKRAALCVSPPPRMAKRTRSGSGAACSVVQRAWRRLKWARYSNATRGCWFTCPITLEAVMPHNSVTLVGPDGPVKYAASALLNYFISSGDFRCPTTRRDISRPEVRRCAKNADMVELRPCFTAYTMAVHSAAREQRAASAAEAAETSSLVAAMDMQFNQVLELMRRRSSAYDCEEAFSEWRASYLRLFRRSVFAANHALITSVDSYLLQWSTNRQQHVSEYSAREDNIASTGFTSALNLLLRTGGTLPSPTVSRITSFNSAARRNRINSRRSPYERPSIIVSDSSSSDEDAPTQPYIQSRILAAASTLG